MHAAALVYVTGIEGCANHKSPVYCFMLAFDDGPDVPAPSDTESTLSLHPSLSVSDLSDEDHASRDEVTDASPSAFTRLKSLLQQRDVQLRVDQHETAPEAFRTEASEDQLLTVNSACIDLPDLARQYMCTKTMLTCVLLHRLSRSCHSRKTGASKPQILLDSQTVSLTMHHQSWWAMIKLPLQLPSTTHRHKKVPLLSHLPSCSKFKHKMRQIEQHSVNKNSSGSCSCSRHWQSSSLQLVSAVSTGKVISVCANGSKSHLHEHQPQSKPV